MSTNSRSTLFSSPQSLMLKCGTSKSAFIGVGSSDSVSDSADDSLDISMSTFSPNVTFGINETHFSGKTFSGMKASKFDADELEKKKESMRQCNAKKTFMRES